MTTSARALYVHDVIDSRPIGSLQYRAIAMCILVAVLDGFDTQTIGMLAPAISRDLGIPITAFGPIFSAGLVGMLAGAMIIGPMADRFGRKTMIVISTLLFGALSFATAYATSFDQLVILRFLTGVGLGGALPTAISLASEYAPKRHARTTVTILMCGMPLGAVFGGLVTSVLLPVSGWPSIFVVGGILPMGTAAVLAFFLPESARFLIARSKNQALLNRIMGSIAPDLGGERVYATQGKAASKVPIGELFANGKAADTLLLWIPYFMNLVVLYFIVSWMPAVLTGAQHPASAGIQAISLFSLGGVLGSVLQGPVMNRYGARRTLVCELLAYGVLAIALSMWTANLTLVFSVSFLMGVAIQGVQAGLNALATEIYPTAMRATGVGCAVGIGRIGSISGPLLGGLMLGLQWNASHIFLAGLLPALIAASALAVAGRAR